jgi:hypothetical protein
VQKVCTTTSEKNTKGQNRISKYNNLRVKYFQQFSEIQIFWSFQAIFLITGISRGFIKNFLQTEGI